MPTIKKRSTGTKIHQEQEIVTLAHTVSHFMAGYRKQFQIAAILLAIALVLYAGYSVVRLRQEQQAAPLVAAAYEYYNPSGGMNSDMKKALDLYRDVQKQFPRTTSGAIAQYYIGNCLAGLGQTEDALKEYQAFVKNYSGEKYLLGLVYQRMAYASAALGRNDEAKKAFEQAETLIGPGLATVELARLYEAAGNSSESQRKYKTVLDNLGGTAWGMEAMSKVQKIETTPRPAETKAAK
jgi:tetratricopeptide (TPR) repeat protein